MSIWFMCVAYSKIWIQEFCWSISKSMELLKGGEGLLKGEKDSLKGRRTP